jgi:hypothetical protein
MPTEKKAPAKKAPAKAPTGKKPVEKVCIPQVDYDRDQAELKRYREQENDAAELRRYREQDSAKSKTVKGATDCKCATH